MANEGVPLLESGYLLAKAVALPPLKLWFNWRFEGLEHVPESGPVLVAGNHISYLDPLAHAYFLVKRGRSPRFLAKAELFDAPVLGGVLRSAKQIPVRRGAGDDSSLERGKRALAGGEVVMVYPEGTVTNDPEYLPMRGKSGVVRLALATGVPITPIATWGGQHVWQKSGRGSLKFARPIWLKAAPPIDLSAHADERGDPDVLRKLTDEVMAALTRLVMQLRSGYPKRWS